MRENPQVRFDEGSGLVLSRDQRERSYGLKSSRRAKKSTHGSTSVKNRDR
jgi:hypothetical protein